MGKTSLRRSYIGESFEANYMSTLSCDFSHFSIKLDNTTIVASLWDLAGQSEYRKIHPMYYKGSMGAIFVYDRTDLESVESIDTWLSDFFKHNSFTGNPILILGNKSDLPDAIDSDFASIYKHHFINYDIFIILRVITYFTFHHIT